jgi:hypothetical protein
MKCATNCQAIAWLAVAVLCVPQLAIAATLPDNQTPVITDLQLHEGGVLIGQVITPEHTAAADVDVLLRSGSQKAVAVKTNKKGHFVFGGLRAGVYQVVASGGQGVYRAWAPNTAPPAARPSALIVARTRTVRGQNAARSFRDFMTHPVVISGLVVTAVAIPVAIHNYAQKTSASGN